MSRIMLLLFGGLGLLALIGGLVWGGDRYALVRAGRHAEGKVVENYKSVSTTGDSERIRTQQVSESYYPVVEFTTSDGEKVRFRGSTGSGVPEYEVGTPVDLIYNPASPHQAQLASFSQLWLGPVVVSGAGLIFFLMGLGSFFLIGQSDRDLDAAQKSLSRAMLAMNPSSIKIAGTIEGVERITGASDGKFVFRCRGTMPGTGESREFLSGSLGFDPGSELVGRPVDIYLEAYDQTSYYVNLDPLLPQIVRHQRR